MPRTGRPPMPTELKRKLGNPGKRRLPPAPMAVLPALLTMPRATAPEDGHALVQRILDAGATAWIGETDQLGVLGLLADAWNERAELRRFVTQHGYGDVAARERPEAKRLGLVEKQITAWLSLLGLTPTDRSRLGVAEVKARTKLEELRARRESRAGHRAG